MQIEEGKFYRTRAGNKAGPMVHDTNHQYGRTNPWREAGKIFSYRDDGLYHTDGDTICGDDLIEEWREPGQPEPSAITASPGYAALARVLQAAHDQAAIGKGHDRHDNGQPFEKQPIIEIGRMLDSTGGHAHQIIKKAHEASRMMARADYAAAIREYLGIINYAAAAVLLAEEFEQEDFAEADPVTAE